MGERDSLFSFLLLRAACLWAVMLFVTWTLYAALVVAQSGSANLRITAGLSIGWLTLSVICAGFWYWIEEMP